MNYPPPWMDKATLIEHISVADTTVDNWVAAGILPPPRKRGNKLMWKWSEVDERLTVGQSAAELDGEAREVRDATRRYFTQRRETH